MGCGGCCWQYTKKGAGVIRKECFTDMLSNSNFFYFVILLWIFLVVVNIIIYGMLLVEMVKLKDSKTQEVFKNIFIQIITGLFTFTAVANLPVRIKRFRDLFIVGGMRNSLVRRPTCSYKDESAFIFDHLRWSTRHVIIQGLLWNCIFQLINQGTRCVYYSAVSAAEVPGVIWVNVFFALSIIMALVAALTQAVAENKFRQEYSLENETTCKKTCNELWHKLWRVQAEGVVGLVSKAHSSNDENSPSNLVQQAGIFKHISKLHEKTVPDSERLSQPSVSLEIYEAGEVEKIVSKSFGSHPGVEMSTINEQ